MKWPKSEAFSEFTPSHHTVNGNSVVKNALRGANSRLSGSSESHRRLPVATLREISATLQPSHRDLSIHILSSFAASKGECRDGEASPVEDRDPGSYDQTTAQIRTVPCARPHIHMPASHAATYPHPRHTTHAIT